jgi:hypothetical protein
MTFSIIVMLSYCIREQYKNEYCAFFHKKFEPVRKTTHQKLRESQALVAHTCNPSHSGGRDQEDCHLKPVRANSS